MASGQTDSDVDDSKVDVAADVEVGKARSASSTSLDLSFKGLHRLPRGLLELVSLEELDLRNNQISDFSEAAQAASNAATEEQSAAADVITSGGATPGQLPRSLRVLRLSANAASELGESLLAGLDLLKVLDLDSNRLRTLPVDLLNCVSLTELHLHRNQLESLPAALGEKLPRLKHLDVSYNMLQGLPESLGQLQELEFLNAKFNQLDKVPASLGRASSLRHLDLSNNFVNLTTVPGTLGFLSCLTFLDLSNNQISVLPVQLGRLRSLEEFNLDNNPLTFPPREILTMDVPEAASGSLSKEDAAKAKAKATTEVVKQFLAAKLKEWDENNGNSGGQGKTWEQWASEWPMLAWLGGYLAGSTTPQLEGAMVSSAPRSAISAASAVELPVQISISTGVGVGSRSTSFAVPEAEGLMQSRSEQPASEPLVVSRQPESSFAGVPLLDRHDGDEEEERGRERVACMA